MSLILFVIGSFAINIQDNLHLKAVGENENNKRLKIIGKKWVVLVAGSNGWINYRHQVLNGLFKLFSK